MLLLGVLLSVLIRAQHSVVSALATPAAPPPPTISIKDNPGEQIAGPTHPEDPSNVAAWRASLTAWRARMLAKIDYNGSIYEVSS
jgi:hypothetical protein